MTSIDYELRAQEEGHRLIGGIDEVGRGCLFGDVVAACLVMPLDDLVEGVADSKKLSEKKRLALDKTIRDKALALGIGRLGPEEIDRVNIKEATRRAMVQAASNLRDREGRRVQADFLLVDAEVLDLKTPQLTLVKGDDLSYSIACASIVAKVYRDGLCQDWDQAYPGYDLAKNKGYGTQAHRQAVRELGPSSYHRMSFLRKILAQDD